HQRRHPGEMAKVIVCGTQRVLEFAQSAGTHGLLYLSSGAIYGTQPAELERISEDFAGAPAELRSESIYGEAKRVAEDLCVSAATSALHPKIARCFAFVAPRLPLGGHFAAGNFLADAVAGRAITVKGDGQPLRSYLYGT